MCILVVESNVSSISVYSRVDTLRYFCLRCQKNLSFSLLHGLQADRSRSVHKLLTSRGLAITMLLSQSCCPGIICSLCWERLISWSLGMHARLFVLNQTSHRNARPFKLSNKARYHTNTKWLKSRDDFDWVPSSSLPARSSINKSNSTACHSKLGPWEKSFLVFLSRMAHTYLRSAAKAVVAQTAESLGFDGVQNSACEALSDLLLRYISEIGYLTHTNAEYAGRPDCNINDLVRLHCPQVMESYRWNFWRSGFSLDIHLSAKNTSKIGNLWSVMKHKEWKHPGQDVVVAYDLG